MCASTGGGDSKFPSSVTSWGHRQEIGAPTASRSPVRRWNSVYMYMFHHLHENALLLLITCNIYASACVCVIYIVGTQTPVPSHWEFLPPAHIWRQWHIPLSWMCKSIVVNRLTSVQNDATHAPALQQVQHRHSCKGANVDGWRSVWLRSPAHGCRFLQRHCSVISVCRERDQWEGSSLVQLFFFSPHRVGSLPPDKNVCVILMYRLSSPCTRRKLKVNTRRTLHLPQSSFPGWLLRWSTGAEISAAPVTGQSAKNKK